MFGGDIVKRLFLSPKKKRKRKRIENKRKEREGCFGAGTVGAWHDIQGRKTFAVNVRETM